MGRTKCSVPGCDTKVWITEKKKSMFTASSDTMLQAWQEALAKVGITDLKKTDGICELHFEVMKIERKRNIYLSGGKVLQVARKKPILVPDAVPTIFPTDVPKKTEYAVKLEPEIFLKGREMFENAHKILEEPSEKDQVTLFPTVPSINSVEINKETKSNLFSTLLIEVREQKPLFPFLENWWVGNSLEDSSIVLTHWKKDRFVIDKRLVISSDLKIRVFIEDREISFPGTNCIRNRYHLGEILKKFTEVSACAKANDIVRAQNCIGYVKKNEGRPRKRCAECVKLRIRLKKSKGVNLTSMKKQKGV